MCWFDMIAKGSVSALLTMSKPLSVERRDYNRVNLLSVDASSSAQYVIWLIMIPLVLHNKRGKQKIKIERVNGQEMSILFYWYS